MSNAFDVWCDFAGPLDDFVHHHCKSADDDIVCQRLPPLDWELYVVSMLTGLMENCGSFADAAGAFPEHADTLQRALARYGCPEAAALVPDCVTLRKDFAADGWTEDFAARRQAIEDQTDWRYRAVVQYLMDHKEDYLFSIFPFCGVPPGGRLEPTP